jgi:hypothetical protein
MRLSRFVVTACVVTALFSAVPASADLTTDVLLARAWPRDPAPGLADLGRGVGIVFTPDLSVPGNCRFYESLGFACFQDTDWSRVLGAIRRFNQTHPDTPLRTLILETHGTNGNGLKLQAGKAPNAERSYISVGALQEQLEPEGVRYLILSACNSGRLLRPMIYRSLDPNPGDKLFLPPTCGIFNASANFNPRRSRMVIMTPSESHIETSLAANVRELAPVARRLLAASAKQRGIKPPTQFAISDMLMQIITRDPRLGLTARGYVDEMSAEVRPAEVSETLYDTFVAYLNALAAREAPVIPRTPAQKTAAKRVR